MPKIIFVSNSYYTGGYSKPSLVQFEQLLEETTPLNNPIELFEQPPIENDYI